MSSNTPDADSYSDSSTDSDGLEQFRERLGELTDEDVDAEAAGQVAAQYPDHVIEQPERISDDLADELTRFTKLYLDDDVERVTRRTDDSVDFWELQVVIGGEQPNTGGVRDQILSKNLFFMGAGIHDGQLHLRFRRVEMEVA